ncbi:ABC transporter ATP-binding protein [Actinocatenispora thailandica]|uniref:ABC transporter ATP-binding protein n=1 Tax=Actinocatenispora thailandica TaxID=227318 RepID=A0A7R7DNQ4_9ACTN|nr:ABC transporter ATP-binding protein [Actinocatenispora thailandica]
MIELRQLTKRYGRTVAVDDLTCTVEPGIVTGFLGPNGAGKSTTMRILLGLDAPTRGAALIAGRRYATIDRPLREVGALLDATAVHGGRTARNHLRWLARTNRIPVTAVDAALDRVGLSQVARRRVGGFSLGMKQRLGLAVALLGDPPVLVLDEPVNGLDPDGVRWIRELLRGLAAEGRTVLLSSHLMSEMQLTADRVIILGRGRLLADTTVTELTERYSGAVLVRTPRGAELAAVLVRAGATVATQPDGQLAVSGLSESAIGDLAAAQRLPLHGVSRRDASLEEAYLRLTAESVQFGGATPLRGGSAPRPAVAPPNRPEPAPTAPGRAVPAPTAPGRAVPAPAAPSRAEPTPTEPGRAVPARTPSGPADGAVTPAGTDTPSPERETR